MQLFADQDGQMLLTQSTAILPLGVLPVWQLNDTTLNLWLLNRTGTTSSPLTVSALAPAYTDIVVACRPVGDLNEAGLLFSASGFTASGTGQTLRYQAEINFNTTAINALFTDATTQTAPALMDIVLIGTSAGATPRQTVVGQWPTTIFRAMYLGTEGVPTSGTPAYPTPSQIALKAPASGGYLIDSSGLLKLWNPDQGIYQTISLKGAAGSEELAISAS